MVSPPSPTSACTRSTPSRHRVRRLLTTTALAVAALAAGPTVGSALAANTVTVGNASGSEGQNLFFTVSLDDNTTAGDLTVDLDTSNGSATEGPDFSGIHVTITFPPDGGAVQPQSINVPTLATCDGLSEGTEQFTATLNTPGPGVTIGAPATGTGTIFDGCANPPPSPNVDLGVFKSDSPDPVQTGQVLVYTIAVQNFSGN